MRSDASVVDHLATLKVLYRRPDTMGLWGIPYEMRRDVGQEPRHIWKQGDPQPVDWVWLGSPGWWGHFTEQEQRAVEAYLASIEGVPTNPGEWSRIADWRAVEPNRTPWVDRNVKKFLPALMRVSPDGSWLPRHEEDKQTFEELGCGHYGCVMPTARADTVFKVTTDPTEAAFVRVAIELSDRDKNGGKWDYGEWPVGMIQYKAIYQLAGATHRKRPIFAIWRQSATNIGFLTGYGKQSYEREEARSLISNAQTGAAALRDWLKRGKPYAGVKKHEDLAWDVVGENYELLERGQSGDSSVDKVIRRYRGAERAAVGLRFYDACIEMMRHNSPIAFAIGQAMEYYREQAIVLADVHLNNIGFATHADFDDEIPTITDPGHAVFLDDRYDGLTIEELES